MKHLLLIALAFAVLATPGIARAAAGECPGTDHALATEARSFNAAKAHNYLSEFVYVQQSVEARANCVDETSGVGQTWNRLFEILDLVDEAQVEEQIDATGGTSIYSKKDIGSLLDSANAVWWQMQKGMMSPQQAKKSKELRHMISDSRTFLSNTRISQ